jgi:hypothetical protein
LYASQPTFFCPGALHDGANSPVLYKYQSIPVLITSAKALPTHQKVARNRWLQQARYCDLEEETWATKLAGEAH